MNTSPVKSTARSAAKYPRQLMAALLLLPLGACFRSITEGGTQDKYGAISLLGASQTGTTATATSSAIFFQAYAVSVPDSRNQSNTCQYSIVDTTKTVSQGSMRAGNSLGLTMGNGANVTTRDMTYDASTARYINTSPVSYKANDSATVSVPGDPVGFPAGSIKVRLAEPLIPEDVTVPTSSGAMQVRWNASPDSTTAIILSLRYANPPASTYANEQIICALKDDGAEDLAGANLGPFLNSPLATRSLKLTRWRTTTFSPADNALLHIVTTIDTVVKLK